jgi:hypothetical protein
MMISRPLEVEPMLRARKQLLTTALAYADTGIVVQPAPPMRRSTERFGVRRQWACSCDDQFCAEPGAHASIEGWLTTTLTASASSESAATGRSCGGRCAPCRTEAESEGPTKLAATYGVRASRCRGRCGMLRLGCGRPAW